MTVQFVPRISYLNPLLFPLELYPRIRVEPGISAHWPAIVSPDRMVELSRHEGGAGPLGTVGGLTKAYFYVEFPDFKTQWRSVRVSGRRESHWQFQGGVVELAVAIKIFVRDTYEPSVDATNLAIFALVMEHELHHVFDEIDIIRRDMPSRVRNHSAVRQWLDRREPVPPNVFDRLFSMYSTPRLITDNLLTRLDERPPGFGFEALLLPIWADIHNRRNEERHDQELQRYRTRIDELLIARTNGRPWSDGAGSDPWRN